MSLFSLRRSASVMVICSATLVGLPLASAIAQAPNRMPPPHAHDAARHSTSNTSSNTKQPTSPQSPPASQTHRETSDEQAASPTPAPTSQSPASQTIVGERAAESKRRAAAALADETHQLTLEEAAAPSTDIAAMAEEAEKAEQKTSPRTITNLNSSVCLAGCN